MFKNVLLTFLAVIIIAGLATLLIGITVQAAVEPSGLNPNQQVIVLGDVYTQGDQVCQHITTGTIPDQPGWHSIGLLPLPQATVLVYSMNGESPMAKYYRSDTVRPISENRPECTPIGSGQ